MHDVRFSVMGTPVCPTRTIKYLGVVLDRDITCKDILLAKAKSKDYVEREGAYRKVERSR